MKHEADNLLWNSFSMSIVSSIFVIVIVISEFLERHSKAKRTTTVHQLIHERCDESKGCPKDSP